VRNVGLDMHLSVTTGNRKTKGAFVIIFKKRLRTKHCAATPRKTQRKGSTARGCVSAIVLGHFLYIHNIQLALFQQVTFELWIFVVVKLDLYESNWGKDIT
jgi:hypothetical protein